MDINSINSKWNDIAGFQELEGYKALRISAGCIPDLFIATDENENRCLLLFLPSNTGIKFKGTIQSLLEDKKETKLERAIAELMVQNKK